MAYILQSRPLPGELPRHVWLESTGCGSGVRVTVANGLGDVVTGEGIADELERLTSGSAICVGSGGIWLERTENAQAWILSFVHVPEVRPIEVAAFDFACALQRIQFERLTLDAAVTVTDIVAPGLRSWEELATSRAIACDR